MPRDHRAAIPALIAVALALAVGIPQALNDLRGDDWVLLEWGRAGEPWAFLISPPPFPYLRPLNALSWQLIARTWGADPWPGELLVFGLWGAALAFLYCIAARATGPWGGLATVALAVSTREVRELVNWRSWLTTTGELAGILGALWLAGRGSRVAPFFALALGAGFKEVAWWHGGAALAASRRYALAALGAAAFIFHVKVLAPPLSPSDVSLDHVARNAVSFGSTLVGWAWPVGLAIMALGAPRSAWRGASVPLLGAAVLACVPPLAFYLYSPFYYLEASLFLLLGLVPIAAETLRHRPRFAAFVGGALALALVRPGQWEDFRDNVPWQQRRLREGRALEILGRGATEVWAPADDVGPCGLAADLLAFDGAVRVAAAPPDARKLRDCLVVR